VSEIRKRSWRVRQLQDWADDMLALRAARKILYGGQMGESHEFEVADLAEEKAAIADGCHVRGPAWTAPPAEGAAIRMRNL
jgi:hypothetical protein